MATDVAGVQEAPSGGVFVRRATGLVREVSPFSTFVFNTAGQPTAVFIAVSIFWALGAFPGGNIYVGLLLAFVVASVAALSYGMFTSAIPRSGGDYVLVGRVTHPVVGIISSFFWVSGVIASIAFIALAFVTVGLAPSFIAVGLVNHAPTLVNWGNTLATSKWWEFGIGAALIGGSSLFLAGGWRWTARFLNTMWLLTIAGLLTTAIVLLVRSNADFIANFNSFAKPITGQPDSYHHLIATAQKNGVNTHPGFSWSNTWPTWGAIMSLSIWTWMSIYISGEVRRARSWAQPGMMIGASVVHIGIAAILGVLFFWRFGHGFFVAIQALNGTKDYPFASPPYYVFLTSIAGGSSVIAWILFFTFVVAFPFWMVQNSATVIRSYFAWAFDGLLPLRVARVHPRLHAPLIAIGFAAVLDVGALVWAIWDSQSFFGVLSEAVLLNITTMIFIGLGAVLLPYRRPEVWRASATAARVAGIPLVAIAGAVSVVLLCIVFFLYLHYPGLGILHRGRFVRDWVIVLAAAVLFYGGALLVRRRQGIDVKMLAEEIPPE
jgi:APA family basic amino acid/polyamine antiporter